MHRSVLLAAIGLTVLSSVQSVRAAGPAGSIIHESTVLVVHLNIEAAKPEQVTQSLKAVLGENAGMADKKVKEILTMWAALDALDVTGLTITQSLEEKESHCEIGMMALTHKPGADTEAIKQWITKQMPLGTIAIDPAGQNVWVYLTKREMSTQPSAAKAAKIAHLVTTQSTGPVTIVFTPNKLLQEEITENAAHGRGIQTMIMGMAVTAVKADWIMLSAKPGEAPTAQIVAEMPDEYSAKQLSTMAAGLLQLGQNIFTQMIAQRGGEAPDLTPVVTTLTPKVDGKRVTVSADTKSIALVGGMMAPAIINARQQALKIKLAGQMRQVLMGIHMYAAEHNDTLPPNLDSLKEYIGGNMEKIYTHPVGGYSPAFKYDNQGAKRLGELKDVSKTVLLVEIDKDGKPIKGGFRGHADGSVIKGEE